MGSRRSRNDIRRPHRGYGMRGRQRQPSAATPAAAATTPTTPTRTAKGCWRTARPSLLASLPVRAATASAPFPGDQGAGIEVEFGFVANQRETGAS